MKKFLVAVAVFLALGACLCLLRSGKGRGASPDIGGKPVPRAQAPPRVDDEGPVGNAGSVVNASGGEARPEAPRSSAPPARMASKDRRAESFRRLIRRPGTSLMKVMESKDSPVPPLSSASISPRGNALLLSGSDNRRLSIHDMAQGIDRVISTAPGSGVGAAWSPGGDRVIYKEVELESGEEKVMVYDTATGRATELGKDGVRCGVPVYSSAGKAGFASGDDLYIYGEDLKLEKTIPLGFEAARLAFSSDGSTVACVGSGAGVSIVDIKRGETRRLVPGKEVDYIGAQFSPDGASLLLGTAGGEVVVADTASGVTRSLGRGCDAQWIEGGCRVLVLRNMGLVADGVDSSQVLALGAAGGEEVILESDTVKLSGISISPDEKILTCVTEQGAVLVFELGGGERG